MLKTKIFSETYRAPLITVSLSLSQTTVYTVGTQIRYWVSASRGVLLYVPLSLILNAPSPKRWPG